MLMMMLIKVVVQTELNFIKIVFLIVQI